MKRAALECQTEADLAQDNCQHRRSSGRRRVATRPDDARLRAKKSDVRHTSQGRLKELTKMRAWASGCVTKAALVIGANVARLASHAGDGGDGDQAPPEYEEERMEGATALLFG